ncbi:MAG: BamA/TamA family outer membrane protein [Thermodesulfobacteriota bacterium]
MLPLLPGVRSYRLDFQGNERLSTWQLGEAIQEERADLDRQGPSAAIADDAAFQIELAYRRAGHPFAEVHYAIEAGQPAVITFRINEGPLVRIRDLRLVGNRDVTAEELAPFLKAHGLTIGPGTAIFEQAGLEAAASEMRDFYLGEGFRQARVRPHVEIDRGAGAAVVEMAIEEGSRAMIREVRFAGEVLPDAAAPLAQLAAEITDTAYVVRKRLLLRSRVLQVYGERGYPEASVAIEEVAGAEPGDLGLVVQITPGPWVRISEVVITGNDKTRDDFIRSRLQLQPGQAFDLAARRGSFHELYSTGLFSEVALDLEPDGAREARRLTVRVTEAPSRELFVEPGWGSYELARLGLGYTDRNLQGSGRVFQAEGGVSVKGERLQLAFTDPWLLGSDLTASLPVSYRRREEPSFTRREAIVTAQLSRQLSDAATASLAYAGSTTRITDLAAGATLEASDTDYNLASLRAQGTFDTRDDLFFPTTGWRLAMGLETADPLLGSQIGFVRWTASARHFLQLGPQSVLGLRYATGLILPGRGQVTIPVSERFFNGGEGSVRSFEESQLGPRDPAAGEPLGGNAYNVLTLELRRRLGESWAGSLFVDAGNISPNRSRAERGLPPYNDSSQVVAATWDEYLRDFRAGIGMGLQYLLPVGPARVDLAVNPWPDEDRGEEPYAVHLSVGMAF